jgi:RimJ/RimL family protein N-acetyltransferase
MRGVTVCSPKREGGVKRPMTDLPLSLARTRLRALCPGDLAAFHAYRGDPDIGRYQSWSAMDEIAAMAFLMAVSGGPAFTPGEWDQIAVASHDGGLLGDIGLCLSADGTEAEIGITLARAAQGRGLATEALRGAFGLVFARTGAGRITGIADARNAPSMRMLARAGMTEADRWPAVFRGEPCEEVRFVLPRP